VVLYSLVEESEGMSRELWDVLLWKGLRAGLGVYLIVVVWVERWRSVLVGILRAVFV
jgi:hypothetical protein